MAAFEDNNPFASPASPSSSRANSYAPYSGYSSFSPVSQSHAPHASIDSTNRPNTSSSEDVPAYQFRATNSDISDPPQEQPEQNVIATSREKEGESCCKIDEIFRKNPEIRIVISDAGKASDGGANFIAYTIEVGVYSLVPTDLYQGLTLRRRYSEFSSLREALVRLFPTLIIPPIPEKHSMCTSFM
jgi:hypothetical protein